MEASIATHILTTLEAKSHKNALLKKEAGPLFKEEQRF